MISRRLRAALLMLKTSAGYRPAFLFRSPRTLLCATPFTVSAAVCNGNCVGMPALRWCVCQLVSGRYGTCARRSGLEFHGTGAQAYGRLVARLRVIQPVDMRGVPGLAVGVREVLREVPGSKRSRNARRRVVVAWHAVGGAVGEQHDDPKARLRAGRHRPQLVPPAIETFHHVGAATGKMPGTSATTLGLSNPRPAGIASSTFAPLLKVSSATRSLSRVERIHERSGGISDRGPTWRRSSSTRPARATGPPFAAWLRRCSRP